MRKQDHDGDDGYRDPKDYDAQRTSAAVALLRTVRLKKRKADAEDGKRKEVRPDRGEPHRAAGKARSSYEWKKR